MNDVLARLGRSRRVALVLASGLCLGLAACEEKDASADALKTAHIKLAALSPFGTPAGAGKNSSDTYNGVITSLQNVTREGTPSQKAAAGLLIAQSQCGLGEPAAAQAGDLERAVLNQLSGVRSRLGQYLTQSAGAAAAASYDPSKELADIEKADKEKAEEIKTEQARKAQVDKQAADLQAQARTLADQARQLRTKASTLHAQIPNQSATKGEQTLVESRKIGREADLLEVKSADLDAQAAKVQPQGNEFQNSIDRLNKQRELLAKERGDIAKRAQDAKDQGAELRAAAAKTAEDIKKAIAQIDELRAGELNAAHEEAAKLYSQASSGARNAAQEMKSTAQMTVGTAQQALGAVLWARARGCQAYASVLEAVATATPALPDGGVYKTKAEEVRNAAKELLEKVREAYKAADTAYGASGATGEAKANLDKLNQRLRDLVQASGGDKEMIPSRGEPASEAPAAEAAPAATPADNSTPQAALQSFIDMTVAGDYDGMVGMMLISNESDRALMKAVIGLAPKVKKIDELTKAKFGQSFSDAAKQLGGQMNTGESPLETLKGIKAADLPSKVEGDNAEFTIAGMDKPLKLTKKDGKWLVVPETANIPADKLALVGPMMAGMSKAFDELAAEIEADKYKDMPSVFAALQQKLAKSMMGPGGG